MPHTKVIRCVAALVLVLSLGSSLLGPAAWASGKTGVRPAPAAAPVWQAGPAGSHARRVETLWSWLLDRLGLSAVAGSGLQPVHGDAGGCTQPDGKSCT
jgi:hypothetical protein